MLTVVDNGESPAPEAEPTAPDNVIHQKFGRPSPADQLRIVAARLDAGEYPEPDHMVILFAYDDLGTPMTCIPGGLEDGHPYFIAGMLQNAALAKLDDASFQAFESEGEL